MGIEALPKAVRAAVVGVADQPLLNVRVIYELLRRYAASARPIVAPRYGGRPGNPVLFDRRLFPELLEVQGDEGGRVIRRRHESEVCWVDVSDEPAGADFDTWEDYLNLLRHQPR